MVPLQEFARGAGGFVAREHSEPLAIQRIVVAAVLKLFGFDGSP